MPDAGAERAPVGVIGGVGPLATAYFLQLVVALTDAERDQDHLDMVVLNHATIPDRTAFVLGRSTQDPGPVLARDAQRLEAFGVSFLVMPCNTAHYFTQQVLDAVSVPFVSIIDTTVQAARERVPGLTTVGILATAGTASSGVYQDAFAARGVEAIVPDEADQALVSQIIYEQVKAGRPVDIATFRAVAGRLVARGASVVVLGCTELSVVAVDHDLLADPVYLDSMDQLARATIRRAGHRVRD
ncbi:aspartate/glutamate racemase family protein [Cellulosimicrobium marinum]|uniref:aspartate/glutamate racemase family protein n=1 Tax=Cellulosimicrobium marinum TaxID=1638992 RepID=UPI001E42D91F|nr:amino acid racemase [Cellulosimicrobium marinum]MCB7138102.1 amino acid racemase [Cellulosimicrobium marinum]